MKYWIKSRCFALPCEANDADKLQSYLRSKLPATGDTVAYVASFTQRILQVLPNGAEMKRDTMKQREKVTVRTVG